ncbi:MAG: bifunctional diguanylate cyclase/phosphodiesterase [Actinomycetota bacterium]|nr:bifunctional diguanylate cyclase/phosphodiesterase [Actinomycetota bacterium]
MQRKRAEQQLDYLKNYDRLTGLANRSLLRDRLAQAVARADREENNMLAVLFLSLDRFKAVNAEFGHSCGDAVLRVVGERIRNQIREGDTVARVGGDEFCLIVEDIEEAHEVISLVTRVLSVFEKPFVVDGQEISVNASVGISARPPSPGHRLLPEAEFAASRAKSQGSSTYQFCTEEMNVQAFERLTLENSLRRALEREKFILHYQPQVDLVTGRVVGAEALLRWRHPEMGLVPPVRFIPVLEETGLIFDVGEWVIHTACEQAKRWTETDFGPLRVAVNISARQFEREDLVEVTSQCLNDTGLPSGCLELELTESVIMADPEKSCAMLERLKSGREVRVSIDDFGTGYSSLSYLKLFALDALKVDKSFVQDVHDAENTAAIVSTIIRLGHDLGLDIVAEGAELEEQLDFLRESGCDQAQGYYFSAPVPADDFTRLLKSEKSLPGFE